MNYSEHGTIVDNILYCPDFSKDLPLTREPEQEVVIEESFKVPESPNKKIKPVKRKGFKRKKTSRLTKPPKKTTTGVGRKPLAVKKVKNSTTKDNVNKKAKDDPKRPPSMCAKTTDNFVACNCQSSASLVLCASNGGGWEGAAVLNHGSYVRMGCLQFTFGISSYAIPSVKIDSTEKPAHDDDISSNASTIAAEDDVKMDVSKSK